MTMQNKKTGYIRKEATEILNIKPSQIQYYTDIGIITPDISAPKGRGTRRIYSKRNLLEILIAKRMIEHGLSTRTVAAIFSTSRMHDHKLPDDIRNLRTMFWNIDSWDCSHSVFVTYHLQQFDHEQFAMGLEFFNKKEKRQREANDKIGHHTKSLIIINVTDLVEKLVKI